MRKILILVVLATLATLPVSVAGRESVADHLPADPLAAGVYNVDLVQLAESLAERFSPLMGRADDGRDPFAEIDVQLGLSLRDDVLAQLGPDLGFALDSTFDELMEAGAGHGFANPETLGGLIIVIGFADREKATLALEALLGLGEMALKVDEDRLSISGGGADAAFLHGRFGKRMLVLSGSAERATAALEGYSAKEALGAGDDFAFAAGQVDAGADLLTYVNLPKIRRGLEQRAGEPGLDDIQRFATDAWMGVGIIHASTRTAGGVRTTRFGPEGIEGLLSPLTGGSLMGSGVFRLLGRLGESRRANMHTKRTMADIRSVGTAVEGFSIDNEAYPTTGGWDGVDAIRPQLEPAYIRTLPANDAWGQPLMVRSDGQSYCIVSKGSDGELEQDWDASSEGGAAKGEGADIVFCNGTFVQWAD